MKKHMDENVELLYTNSAQWWELLKEEIDRSRRYDPHIRNKYPLRVSVLQHPLTRSVWDIFLSDTAFLIVE